MNDNTNEPVTSGVHHVGLTIPSLDTTRKFFLNVLNFTQIGEVPDYPAAFLTDGNIMLTLWQVSDPVNAVPFDRKNVIGLHHLALKVADVAALDGLYERLQQVDTVDIEFAPEPLHDGPVRHMMCHIPGGIRIEFIAPGS